MFITLYTRNIYICVFFSFSTYAAINMRNKMLKNSVNEENTKIIDDSIDWFENDIKHTLNIHDINFSCYDDDTKNEIVNKYYDIFKKKISKTILYILISFLIQLVEYVHL